MPQMTYRETHSDLMTGAVTVMGGIAVLFFLIGIFVGWTVWADTPATMPDACDGLTASDCAARASEGW